MLTVMDKGWNVLSALKRPNSVLKGVTKGRVPKKKIVEFSTKVGGSATADFPLRKKNKKHGLKTLDFA